MASGEKDPMICRHCDNYYEYKGEVCLDNGQLEIKVAVNQEAKNYLERKIRYLTGIEKPKKEEKTKETKRQRPFTTKSQQTVNYHCLVCHEEEKIPYDVVRDLDIMDGGDPSVPPQFSCEKCIQNTIKAFVVMNTNSQMSSHRDKGPGGLSRFFIK